MAKDVLKEFEKGFAGYHKDAPAHLAKERAKLHSSAKSKALERKKGKNNVDDRMFELEERKKHRIKGLGHN